MHSKNLSIAKTTKTTMSTPNDPAAALAEAVRELSKSKGYCTFWIVFSRVEKALAAYEEAVKQITYVGVSPPSERDGDKFQIENLVVLVMRLCALLPPDKQARVAALDYLQRHKLTPSPLREQIEAAKAVAEKAEEWRAVVGFEGYQVSDHGRVKSLDRCIEYPDGRRQFLKGKMLKPWVDTKGYINVNFPNRKHYRIHRLVAEAFLGGTKDMVIDHADGDKKNNCLSNLRVCSRTLNNANGKIQKNSTSGFKGACWDKERGKWLARIQFNGKQMFLGYFDTKEKSARAYDEAALRLFGSFARTNANMKISEELIKQSQP